MGGDDWEDLADPLEGEIGDMRILDPSPAYEDPAPPLPPRDKLPPQLRVLGATWGGVNVLAEVSDMARANHTIALNMRTVHRDLVPDPASGVVKTLTVLYQYEGEAEDGDDPLRVLNVSEYSASSQVIISATAHEKQKQLSTFGLEGSSIITLDRETFWRDGQVEILAALYGPKRIQTPAVLEELANFFEGRRGQIRMTNNFFGIDPRPYHRKSWTVYFRFLNSKKIQCVTGMEDGALEVPWTRD